MTAIEIKLDDPETTSTYLRRGALYDETHNKLCHKVFESQDQAQAFLSAIERAGVHIYYGTPADELEKYFQLWYDAWKRPE